MMALENSAFKREIIHGIELLNLRELLPYSSYISIRVDCGGILILEFYPMEWRNFSCL